MAKITIDDKEYDSENLSEETLNQFNSIRLTDVKLAELRRDLGITQTARNAYAMALKAALDNEDFDEDQVTLLEDDENLKFDEIYLSLDHVIVGGIFSDEYSDIL